MTATSLGGRRRVPATALLGGLAVGLTAVAVWSAATGAFGIPPLEVLGSFTNRFGFVLGRMPDDMGDSVLWEIRFPRVALTVLVGASLGCAGAAMQGTFSNPLAEPGIVGVSSGAAMGAVIQIVMGLNGFGTWSSMLAAFIGGTITVLGVYLTSRTDGRTEIVTLVLTGIAVNAFTGAVIGLLTYFSNDSELRSITFWNLGSMAQATWPKVAVVAPVTLLGLAVVLASARKLDLLALGERPARHLGLDVERLRITVLFAVAVLSASAVAVSGTVQFVGLVIPHIMRGIAGPGHRVLLPASALGGALILVLADLACRTIAAPAEVPLGVLTALVGSPFFFWMLRRTRSAQGGWA